MATFTPSAENLRIAVDDNDVERYAIAAARVLSRTGEKKVFFLSMVPIQYPLLKRFKGVAITFLSSGQTSPGLMQSARLVHSKGQLVIASPGLTGEQWKRVADDIAADVARAGVAG